MSAKRPSKIVPRPCETENPKYEKKQTIYRNQALSKAICELQWCARCGKLTDVTHCHSNRAKFGKGKSIKASDAAQSALCNDCHMWLDQGKASREEKHNAEDAAIVDTYLMLIREGVIRGKLGNYSQYVTENVVLSMERGDIYLSDERHLT